VSAGVGSTEPAASLVPLRKNRDFVLLQVGQTLSTIGSESTGIAYPLLVLAITHSPVQAGVVGFARIVPWALFGFLAGAAVDRLRRKRMMIVSDVVRIAAVASIVVAIAVERISFAQIAIVAFIEGTMFVFFNVAEIGALRSVVPGRQLPAAAAAEQARYSTVTLVAPPLGGLLFGLGRALPFLVDAVSYVFSLVSLLAIRTPFQEEREQEQVPLRAQLAEGFRWLWGQPFLRTCALLFTWVNLFFEGIFLVLIVVGRRQGLSGAHIGALIAALGLSSLAGSLVHAHVRGGIPLAQPRNRRIRRQAEHLRAPGGRDPWGLHWSERERCRDRLSRRGRSRPVDGPRQQRRTHDRALRGTARPPRRGPPARFVLREDHGRDLRRRHAGALCDREPECVDSQRTEPRRARPPTYA